MIIQSVFLTHLLILENGKQFTLLFLITSLINVQVLRMSSKNVEIKKTVFTNILLCFDMSLKFLCVLIFPSSRWTYHTETSFLTDSQPRTFHHSPLYLFDLWAVIYRSVYAKCMSFICSVFMKKVQLFIHLSLQD